MALTAARIASTFSASVGARWVAAPSGVAPSAVAADWINDSFLSWSAGNNVSSVRVPATSGSAASCRAMRRASAADAAMISAELIAASGTLLSSR